MTPAGGIPDRFRPFVVFGPGEQMLGCWFARFISFDRYGRVIFARYRELGYPVVRVNNHFVHQDDPNTHNTILVLTNHRLLYVLPPSDQTAKSPARQGLDWLVPLTAITKVTIEKHPDLWQRLLTLVVVTGTRPVGGKEAADVAPVLGKVSFLIDASEPVEQIFQKVLASAEVAGSEASRALYEAGARPDPTSIPDFLRSGTQGPGAPVSSESGAGYSPAPHPPRSTKCPLCGSQMELQGDSLVCPQGDFESYSPAG